jgi:dissimilatory sulfite reductase (desulfoviridin) alpha/beta subunit
MAGPVDEIRYCDWCDAWLPADHDCPASAVGCTTRQPDETPCGGCGSCIAAMTADLRRREHPFTEGPYGSPSDIDTPWSST